MRLNLKIAIVASGKSQRQIAASCERPIPENRFSEIVRGWVDPRPHERKAIADVLGKPEEQLFDEEREPECVTASPAA